MDVPVDQREHVHGALAELGSDGRLIRRIPLDHAAKEDRLVAAVVEERAVPETLDEVDKPAPDVLFLLGRISPERMMRGSGCLQSADEVVGVARRVAFDVQVDDRRGRPPRREFRGHENMRTLLADRESLERPFVADSFPASVGPERVRELGDRENALLMRRREFGLLEPRHQAEVIGLDRAPSTLVAEAARFAVPIDHEPRGGTRCKNPKSVHSST